jgi:hypothetical protein
MRDIGIQNKLPQWDWYTCDTRDFELTGIWIRGVEIPDEDDKENDGQWYGDHPDTPHDEAMSLRGANDRIKGSPNQ